MARDNSSFFVLLGILDAEASSGYDIKKKVENEIGHYYRISNSQIYPTLKKLLELGYATFLVERNDGKPDRKVYSVTESGRAVFREWLKRPVDYQNPGGNELLLKIYFGPITDIGRNIELISRHREIQAEMYRVYIDIEKNYFTGKMDSAQMYYSFITLVHGLMLTQASMAWCDEAIALLKDMETKELTK
jgi:PadR family transcriptional regulator, regulatory protein AphA